MTSPTGGDNFANYNFGQQHIGQQFNFHQSPKPQVRHSVLERNTRICTDDAPQFVTAFGVEIADHYAVRRLHMEGRTPHACSPPNILTPDGGPLGIGGGSPVLGVSATAAYMDLAHAPAPAFIFVVITNQPSDVTFDATLN